MRNLTLQSVVIGSLCLLLASALIAQPEPPPEEYNSPRDGARIAVQERNGWPAALNLNAYYNRIDKSPEGLDRHRRNMFWVQDQVREMQLEECQVTITFEQPLSVAELSELVLENDIEGRLFYAFVDDGGQVSTLAVSLESSVYEGGLRLADEFEQAEPGWVGVVSLVGIIPGERLDALQDDERVWLVDVVADRNVVWNESHSQYIQHFGWDLYRHQQAGAM